MTNSLSATARSLLASCILLGSCGTQQIQHHSPIETDSRPPASLDVHNIMPDFWQWWATVEHLEPEKQAELFWGEFRPKHRDIFNEAVLGRGFSDDATALATLRAYFAKFPAFASTMRSISPTLPGVLNRQYEAFRKRFPDISWRGPAYVVPSMGTFDGGTRLVNGKDQLLFGVDGIAVVHDVHKESDIAAFFAHEIFHVYQAQFEPESKGDDELWRAIWHEGLATYVASQLCPQVTEAELLMSPTLAAEVRPLAEQIATALRDNLHSTSHDTYSRYFLTGYGKDIPDRSGYYLSYWVARDIAAAYPLEQLPRLNPQKVVDLIDTSLKRISQSTPEQLGRVLGCWQLNPPQQSSPGQSKLQNGAVSFMLAFSDP